MADWNSTAAAGHRGSGARPGCGAASREDMQLLASLSEADGVVVAGLREETLQRGGARGGRAPAARRSPGDSGSAPAPPPRPAGPCGVLLGYRRRKERLSDGGRRHSAESRLLSHIRRLAKAGFGFRVASLAQISNFREATKFSKPRWKQQLETGTLRAAVTVQVAANMGLRLVWQGPVRRAFLFFTFHRDA